MIFINNIHSDESMNLLKSILINNYQEYFFENDDFRIVGNVSSKGIVYIVH
jgi:hypothetical protein